jgi:anti-anti-sigma factor
VEEVLRNVESLRTDVEHTPAADILHLEGEVDDVSASVFRDRLSQLLGTTRPLIVDFSRLKYLGLSGVHVLEEAHRRASEMGQSIVLVGSDPIVHRILGIVHLNERIPLYDSIGEAIGSLRPRGGGDGSEAR